MAEYKLYIQCMHFSHLAKKLLNIAQLFFYNVLCMSLGLHEHGQRL